MILLLGMALSVLLIGPLILKCKIRPKSGFLGILLIGLTTAMILYALVLDINLNYPQVLLIQVALIMMLAAAIGAFKFYRDPERIPPQEPHIIVSPADGRVLYVKKIISGKIPYSDKGKNTYRLEELTNTDLLADGLYTIGIMMSILDVHVNRVPVKGKVVFLTFTPGDYLSLRKEQAPVKNLRLTTVIDQGTFKIGVVQIASRLVRRIQSYLEKGQLVELGQRLGMIKFGSQVDLIIPQLKNIKIEVKPDDEVKAGVSVLARYD